MEQTCLSLFLLAVIKITHRAPKWRLCSLLCKTCLTCLCAAYVPYAPSWLMSLRSVRAFCLTCIHALSAFAPYVPNSHVPYLSVLRALFVHLKIFSGLIYSTVQTFLFLRTLKGSTTRTVFMCVKKQTWNFLSGEIFKAYLKRKIN